VKLAPKNARIYANRGMLKLRQGKSEDAQKDFSKAVELEPSLREKIQALAGEQKGAPPEKK
jgi:Tfp pilus assembly protein PilF